MLNNVVPTPFLYTGPAFPVDAYPVDLWRAAVAIQIQTQAPGELILNSILQALSGVYSPHFDVEGLNGTSIPTSLFMLAVAPSGEGKTSALRAVNQPILAFSRKLETISTQMMDEWETTQKEWSSILDGLSAKKAKLIVNGESIDEIQKKLSIHRSAKPNKPKIVRMITNDATPAGLKVWLSSGLGSGLVLNADAGKLITGPLLNEASLLCDIWSGESITIDRGNYSLTISDPRVTFSLMTQPNFAHELLQKHGESFRGSGLSGRMLSYAPTSRIGRRQLGASVTEEDNQALNLYHERLDKELERLNSDGQRLCERKVVKLCPSARHCLIEVAQNIEFQMGPGGDFHFMPEFATKIVEHTCRIAALFTLYEGSEKDEVSLENVHRAISIVDYFARQYAATHSPYFGPVRDIINANELLSFIMAKGQFGMYDVPRTLIMQNAPASLRKKNNLDAAINILMDYGRIVMCQIPGKRAGNSRMAYRIVTPTPLPLPQF